MVALAEPKKKTKWTLNPRGKLWSNDDTKVGQKLLEKMGWSKGKGLGKAEQGDVDPIRLNYNTDSKGMGFKGNNEEWVATKEEFDSLLGKLKESHAEDAATASADSNVDSQGEEAGPSRPSLEVRSKHSRARVHYHKFVRGKDLSRYSAEDLSCILGNKKSKDKQKDTSEDDSPQEEASALGAISKSHGVTTIQGGNLNEYFASKMAKLASIANLAANSKAASEEEALDEAEKPAVKKRRKSVIFNEEALVEEFVFNKHSPLEKKKKRKKAEDSDASDEAVPEPSKKKKKLPMDDVTNNNEAETVCQENADQSTGKGKKKKNSLTAEKAKPVREATDNQEDEPTKKTKKKKEKGEDHETIAIEDQQICEVREKKKKKKRQDVEESSEEVPNESGSEKKKKKKKDKEQETYVPEDQKPVDIGESKKHKKEKLPAVETNDVNEPTKKKKRKKETVNPSDFAQTSNKIEILEQQCHEEPAEEPCSFPTKEKKKKKDKNGKVKATSPAAEIDNNINEMLESLDAASGNIEVPISTSESCEPSSKKKKKKKTKAESESTITEQDSEETGNVQGTAQEEKEGEAAKGKKTKKGTSETFNQRARFKLKDFVPKEKKKAVKKSVPAPVPVPVPAAPNPNTNSSQPPTFEYLKTSGIRPDAMNKIHSLYRQARFDLFVGANLDSIRGYGY